MAQQSLEKSKIKFLLLEGVHPSARATLQQSGYSNIEEHKKACLLYTSDAADE